MESGSLQETKEDMRNLYLVVVLGLASSIAGARDLQSEIDALASSGGGTLTLTSGVYRTGALFFKPGVNLHLDKGAVIEGVDEAEGYPMRETRIEGETCLYYPALINADHCDGFRISGEGVIDGHGANTWEEFWTKRAAARRKKGDLRNKDLMRPRLLYISNSKNVDISGVTFKNSKFWTTHYYNCEDVLVHDCTILAEVLKDSQGKELKGPSTDGIDIDKCRRFTVRNVTIAVNDDGVCIKGGKGAYANDYERHPENGPSSDVLVENCTFRYPTHSCLTLGSECPEANLITMRNCQVEGAGNVLNLKMRTDTPQDYANVLVENVTGSCQTLLNVKGWTQYADLGGRTAGEVKSRCRNVLVRNCDVTCRKKVDYRRDNTVFNLTNVRLENITINGMPTKDETLGSIVKVAENAPLAVKRAAEILRAKVASDTLPIRLEVGPVLGLKHDGYVVNRTAEGYVITGSRPRALLYAAGEPERWLGREKTMRDPAFATRMLNYTGKLHDPADWIAATGANMIHLGRKAPPHKVAEYKAYDVDVYAFIYGCDAKKWGREAFEQFLAAHPEAKGTDPGNSWEKGLLCPSQPATWDFVRETVTACLTAAPYDGLVATFWDDYGMNCQCVTCQKNGMNDFPNQIAKLVKTYEEALKPLGKQLIVRTWASGAPHFLGTEWVHAPGYAGVEDAWATWGPAIEASAPETIFQTKVYNADCQPNPPFSNLLGRARPRGRREFAEWQITGQTVGRQSFPASVCEHTAWTMKRAFELVGPEGGICLYAGGYRNANYEALDDRLNSINLKMWRQLAWDPADDPERIWRDWAKPLYGRHAPAVIDALKASERVTVASFSPLGFGAPTESDFAKTIARRETLLRYTNRQYLPEYQKFLEPTKENIARVIAEKDDAMAALDRVVEKLPNDVELCRRFTWLRTHLVVSKALDESLWRFRRLRHLMGMGEPTDPEELTAIECCYEVVRTEAPKLFEGSDFTLGSPIPLMRDIFLSAKAVAEKSIPPKGARK